MVKFLHRFELRIAAVAAVALLLAQLGALSHAYSHDLAAAHQSGASSSHEPCNDCLGYAPVLSAGGAQSAPPLLEAERHGRIAHDVSRSCIAHSVTLAFRSRAPPESSPAF